MLPVLYHLSFILPSLSSQLSTTQIFRLIVIFPHTLNILFCYLSIVAEGNSVILAANVSCFPPPVALKICFLGMLSISLKRV